MILSFWVVRKLKYSVTLRDLDIIKSLLRGKNFLLNRVENVRFVLVMDWKTQKPLGKNPLFVLIFLIIDLHVILSIDIVKEV